MVILASAPSEPSPVVTTTPAMRPPSAWSKLVTLAFIIVPRSALATEPVRSRRVVVP